jgi:muramoyltetrapeptide carboxypeptidase
LTSDGSKSSKQRANIIFTSSRFDFNRLEKGAELFQHHFSDITSPFKIPEPPNGHHHYCAPLQERIDSILSALDTPDPTLLLPPRGGYGCAECLGHLPTSLNIWKGKTLIGYSDITAFHAFLNNMNIPSIHGPMLATQGWLDSSNEERASLKTCIQNKAQELSLNYKGPPQKGRLVGGNLTVLASLMGTPHQLQLQKGDLLFLEDINEAPYALSRSLFQLSHSPNFQFCQLIWGHLTQCKGPYGSEKELITALMKTYPNMKTSAWGLAAGHEGPNFSLPLGRGAQLYDGQLIVGLNP